MKPSASLYERNNSLFLSNQNYFSKGILVAFSSWHKYVLITALMIYLLFISIVTFFISESSFNVTKSAHKTITTSNANQNFLGTYQNELVTG